MNAPEIEQWNNRGRVSVWHYEGFPRNYHGYHLNADSGGCEFLKGLAGRFRSSCFPAGKSFKLAAPTAPQLRVPGCCVKCVPAVRLELRYMPDAPEDHWLLEDREGHLLIEMGLSKLAEFERGIDDILRRTGDWAIHGNSRSLWFWW
jgi:hypothetical protein